MDTRKTGSLIFKLRTEHKMTQKDLAELINVSDKAVSKWECGQGCPDITLLPSLSRVFGVDIEQLLAGELTENRTDGGNMNRILFYVCPECGNVLTATGNAQISCCGRKLEPLEAKKLTEVDEHKATIQEMDGEYYVTFNHPMTKDHYIVFASYVTYAQVFITRLYPEQEAAFHMPELHGGKLYVYCSQHGLKV